MKVLLIRHGKTQGNLEGRYIGRTDEPLLASEKEVLQTSEYRRYNPDIVYCSRMLRCRQTAEILFGPNAADPAKKRRDTYSCLTSEHIGKSLEYRIWPGLEETDFGEFEYKNYDELKTNPAYQIWIDSGGRLAFPGGESGIEFRRRCCRAFAECIQDALRWKADRIAFVVHGGTIMSIMEAYAGPEADFYSWQPKNGEGYLTELVLDEENKIFLSVTDKEL